MEDSVSIALEDRGGKGACLDDCFVVDGDEHSHDNKDNKKKPANWSARQ